MWMKSEQIRSDYVLMELIGFVSVLQQTWRAVGAAEIQMSDEVMSLSRCSDSAFFFSFF